MTRRAKTERQAFIHGPKPEEVSRFLKSPETERYVRNAALAFFKPEDYPTHDMLQQMMLVAPFPEHDVTKSITSQLCSPHGTSSGRQPKAWTLAAYLRVAKREVIKAIWLAAEQSCGERLRQR